MATISLEVDTLVYARWIIPIEPHNTVLHNHALVVNHGRIIDLLPASMASAQYRSPNTLHLDQHALLPGLINAHAHSPMTLLRGLADDLALMTWLTEHIWPAEQRWMDAEFIRLGSQLAFLEMIRGGTTCFAENYFFSEISANAAAEAGLRALIGALVITVPTRYAQTTSEYLAHMRQFCQKWRNHPLIQASVEPHAPYTVDDDTFSIIKNFADEHQLMIQIHLHETQSEVEQSVAQYGKRPIRRLHDLGLFSPRLQCAHMVHIQDEDLEILQSTHPHIVTCPESNLKLASGICPVKRLTDAGLTVAIGTDGAASNNDLDMFSEMRSASLLAKVASQDPTAISAAETLRMATLNGAKALGMEDLTGSLVIGKAADFIAVDLSWPNTQPLYNPISQLVYAAHCEQVTDVWVAGKRLLASGQFTTLDSAEILARAQQFSLHLANK